MAVNLSPVGGVAAQFFTNAGVPLSGGKIYTYTAGTSTPQATFTTSAGNIQHSNPIVLDAAGRVPTGEIWLTDSVAYKFVIKDSSDVLVGTYDNIIGINSNFVNYVNKQEIQTATAGQTVFNLTTMEYQPGTGNLSVFVDGVNQYGPGAQYAYTETDSNTVTFVSGLHVGASVKFTSTQIQNAYVTDATQVEYIPPFANSVATNVSDKLGQYVSVIDFGADPSGTADSTTAINNALSASENVYFPDGTYLTTGNHSITTQHIYGASKKNTIIKRSSGVNPIFKLVNVGQIETMTLDGNQLNGAALLISTDTAGDYFPSYVDNLLIQNVGNPTVLTKTISGATNASQCVVTCNSHGFSAGDLIQIRNVDGLYSSGNPTKSVLNAVFKIVSVTTNNFTLNVNTTSWTAYVTGGTAELAPFALQVEQMTGGYAALGKTISNVEFRSNYGHIYLGYTNNTTFNRMMMFGNTPNCAIYINSLDCQNIYFTNTYMESGVRTAFYSIRDITFNDTQAYFSAWTAPWIQSIGMNSSSGTAGGEVANFLINDLTVVRTIASTEPIIDTDGYEWTINYSRVRDAVSGAGWAVIRDRGTQHLRIQDFTVESANSWLLFTADSSSSTMTHADGIYYTQGVIGSCVWSNSNALYTSTGFISVKNSNCNHSIKATANARGFWFENINGNVDLTNASAGGSFLFNIAGTVTDPNKAASIYITQGNGIKLNTQKVYADNAAAVAAGLTVGTVYQTSTGVLMIVY